MIFFVVKASPIEYLSAKYAPVAVCIRLHTLLKRNRKFNIGFSGSNSKKDVFAGSSFSLQCNI